MSPEISLKQLITGSSAKKNLKLKIFGGPCGTRTLDLIKVLNGPLSRKLSTKYKCQYKNVHFWLNKNVQFIPY